jgi:hypothetical protein
MGSEIENRYQDQKCGLRSGIRIKIEDADRGQKLESRSRLWIRVARLRIRIEINDRARDRIEDGNLSQK